jgi:hypothetical protein
MRTTVRKSDAPSRRLPDRGNERRLVTQHPRRRILSLVAGAAAMPVVSRMASGQAYPSRPITMVVPSAAGGPADVLARILANSMRTSLGQPLIIENISGADGSIGTGRVARARPDGYTIEVGFLGPNVLNGAFYSLPYNVMPVRLSERGALNRRCAAMSCSRFCLVSI